MAGQTDHLLASGDGHDQLLRRLSRQRRTLADYGDQVRELQAGQRALEAEMQELRLELQRFRQEQREFALTTQAALRQLLSDSVGPR